MSNIEIPCPNCGSHLKIPDRSLLGKKGKCGKCGHRFIMTEPAPIQFDNPVQFELANPAPRLDETMVGEFVKYVPENAPQEEFGRAAPPPPAPVYRQSAPAVMQPPPQAYSPPPPVYSPPPSALPPLVESEPADTTARLRQKRKKKSPGVQYAIIALVAIAVLGGGAAAYFGLSQPPAKKGGKAGTKATDGHKGSSKPKKPATEDEEDADDEDAQAGQPQPIDMTMMPNGVEVLIHLRPAQLWSDEGVVKEFRFGMGPLAAALEKLLKDECLQDPKNLEEVLLGILPGERGAPVNLCGVIRTVKDSKKSELLSLMQAPVEQIGPKEVYVNEKRAWIIKDGRTYAFAPPDSKQELVDFFDTPTEPRVELQNLLPATDRRRLITIAAINETLAAHEESLVSADVRPFLRQVVEWCTTDVKSCAWSLQLVNEQLDSEIIMTPDLGRSTRKLKANFETTLEETPKKILDMVMVTHPDTVGRRKFVGRLPAMTKVYAMATTIRDEKQCIKLQTKLPQQAAPNLAIAGLFAWNLTTRPDFGSAQSTEPSGPTKTEDNLTIAQRLEKVMPEVDFRDEMMYSAFNFIGDDIGVTFKMEGEDLKAAGFTQNVKQKFKMQNVKATVVIDKILTKLGLCIYVDEDKKVVHVTSLAAAKDKGWKPFPLTDK